MALTTPWKLTNTCSRMCRGWTKTLYDTLAADKKALEAKMEMENGGENGENKKNGKDAVVTVGKQWEFQKNFG